MINTSNEKNLARRSFIAAAGLLICASLLFLANSVVADLSKLASAQSDNQQWTLTQAEVEFLEFSKELAATDPETEEFSDLKRRFDVFYSRIVTLENGSVYDVLNDDQSYRLSMENVRKFLDDAAQIIDGPKNEFPNRLTELSDLTNAIRPAVRQLANNALMQFTTLSEKRRIEFAQTLQKLAFAVVFLLAALTATTVYLRRLAILASDQRKQAVRAAARTDTVIQTSLDGVIVADQDGKILAFNSAAERIFGHRPDDVIGSKLGPLIVPDHHLDAHEAGMKRIKAGGQRHVVGKGRIRLEAKHKSGRIFPVELAIQSAETDQGTVFIAFLRDVSAQVHAEKELVTARDEALAADRLKTEFLATMSHEIRTPLNGLLGNLTLLGDTKLSPIQKRYIQNMSTSGDLLLQHVTDVLDLSRYDVENADLWKIPVNLSHLIQSIVDSQSGAAEANNSTLEWHWLENRHDWVLSDPDALQLILINLVGNAVKFTRNGRVSISISAVPKTERTCEFVIHVADTGTGIPPDLMDRMFDDFVTGSVAYDREVGGTGLGLSIVKRSLRALGGEIDVESEPGVGTTFEIRLSLETTEGTPATNRPAPPIQLPSRLSILIVEDNEINSTITRELLGQAGHETEEVYDGAAALKAASQKPYDLILMDISMPIMDGRTATREIRRKPGLNSTTPIIALTANAMPNEKEAFLKDGMNGVLTKPLSRQALNAELSRLFGGASISDTSHLSHRDEMRNVMGEEAFQDIRKRFIEQVEDFHGWLNDLENREPAAIAARSHNLAGSAAVFGMERYRDALAQLENAAKGAHAEEMKQTASTLFTVWESERAVL